MTATAIADRLANLPLITVGDRVARLRARIETERLDALLVSSHSNIRWITGFTGSAGLVVVTADDLLLVTDGRYTE